MDIAQNPKALELLLNHLEDRQPESLPVYNLVRHVKDKKWDRTQIFVDDNNIKNCTTILCHGPSIGAKVDDSSWYLYCDDPDKLTLMFDKVRLTERRLDGYNPTDTVIFMCLDNKFLNTIIQYMNNHGFQIDQNYTHRLYIRELNKATIENMQKQAQSLPKGYTMAPLKPQHAELLVSKTSYSSPTAVPLCRKMIEEFPSVAIYVPNRVDPVSWALMIQHGEPGFGYTHPEYRNKKFAQIRSAEMMSRLFDNGYKHVCLSAPENNTAMLQVFKKYPGLMPLDLVHYSVFKKTPHMSITSKL